MDDNATLEKMATLENGAIPEGSVVPEGSAASKDGATLQVYQCPTCGGAVRFDADSGRLSCMWCGNSYEATSLLAKQTDSHMQEYLCPECGAELMADSFIAADTCPYCGNNEIAPHRFEGKFAPDFIIPFAVTKTRAIDCYERALAEKRFLPDDFIAQAHVISVQGTYVPFWLQDGVVDFDFTFICDYKQEKMMYTTHRRKGGTYEYSRVPADGSARMADDMMDSIEPYDYHALEAFSPGYLPGFVAERYTVQPDEVNKRIAVRVKNSACSAAKKTIDENFLYCYPDYERWHATVDHGASEQVLLPVWLIVVACKGEKYLVGVNGQTGNVAVNLPVDAGKQRMAALAKALKEALVGALVPLILGLVVLAVCVGTLGFDGSVAYLANLANGLFTGQASPPDTFIAAFTILYFSASIIVPSIFAFKNAKREAAATMRNVNPATNADDFDIGGLSVTLDEKEQGPLRAKSQ